MITSTILLMVGSVDAIRTSRAGTTRVRRAAALVAALLLIASLSTFVLGLDWYWTVACGTAAAAWVLLMPLTTSPEKTDGPVLAPVWPAIALLVLLVGVVLVDRTTAAMPTSISELIGVAPRAGLLRTSTDTLLAACAVALALTQTANIIVRAALGRSDAAARELVLPTRTRASQPDIVAPRRPGRIWHRWIQALDARPELPAASMRGGRHIGPLERLLLTTAILAGAYPIIAGLLAAKGIVRFPEISADHASGGKAEEFLVGSLTSWSIAGAASIYLAVIHAS